MGNVKHNRDHIWYIHLLLWWSDRGIWSLLSPCGKHYGLSDIDNGLFLSDFCTLLSLLKKKKLMKKHWLHSEFPINGLTPAADAFSK